MFERWRIDARLMAKRHKHPVESLEKQHMDMRVRLMVDAANKLNEKGRLMFNKKCYPPIPKDSITVDGLYPAQLSIIGQAMINHGVPVKMDGSGNMGINDCSITFLPPGSNAEDY